MIVPSKPIDLVLVENRDIDLALRVLNQQAAGFKFNNIHLINDPTIVDNISYSRFILEKLSDIITGEYALITQTDGFILNKVAWTDEFLEYDYIGAPWFTAMGCTYANHPPITIDNCVGNGGFSLRSLRLLEATAELAQYSSDDKIYPEDRFICTSARHQLEYKGIKFAPPELAARFSVENSMYNGQFGFHGKLTMKFNSISV